MKIIISRSMHYSAFTPEIDAQFKKWFGKSVVKDGDNPRICYHGSPDEIRVFDPKYTGNGMDASGIGFYFTSGIDDAHRYIDGADDRNRGKSGQNIMPVYLKIQKPIRFEKQPQITAAQVRKLTGNMYVRKAYTQFIKDNWDVGYQGFASASQEYRDNVVGIDLIHASFSIYSDIYADSDVAHMFPQLFKEATGYDGIIRANSETTHYIVFSPTQIKSAVGNNGKFSIRNPDLTK